MMPFNLSFRRLVLKYIPQLKSEDIDRHESLLALRLQLVHERNYAPPDLLPPGENGDDNDDGEPHKPAPDDKKSREGEGTGKPSGEQEESKSGKETGQQPGKSSQNEDDDTPYQRDINKKIEHVSREAQAIVAPVARLFNAVQRLWIARRQFAVAQGHFLQIPPSVEGLVRFIGAGLRYTFVSAVTLPRLEINRVGYYIRNLSPLGIFIGIISVGLVVVAVDRVTSGDTGMPPKVGDFLSQTIPEGETFAPISLDSLVSDPDNEPDELTWEASGNKELSVDIDENRLAAIIIPHEDWNGEEHITFTVSDPGGLSDSGGTVFTVSGINDPPKITSAPPDSAAANTLYQYQVTAEDPDLPYGDVLKYTLMFAPEFLSIDSLSGLVSGTPDSTDIGSHEVAVQVNDGNGGTDTQDYQLNVLIQSIDLD
jgi:hypothetical protein